MKGNVLATTIILVLFFAGCAYADGVIRTNETRGEEPAPSEGDTSDNATSDEPWVIAPNPNVTAKDGETSESVDELVDQGIIPRNATADERDSNATKGEVFGDDTKGEENSLIVPSSQVDDAIPGEGSSTRLLFAVPLICGALVVAALGFARRRH